jgi:hypothetical protein
MSLASDPARLAASAAPSPVPIPFSLPAIGKISGKCHVAARFAQNPDSLFPGNVARVAQNPDSISCKSFYCRPELLIWRNVEVPEKKKTKIKAVQS